MDKTEAVCAGAKYTEDKLQQIYPQPIEDALKRLEPYLQIEDARLRRWVSLRLLDEDVSLTASIGKFTGNDFESNEALSLALKESREHLEENGIPFEKIASSIVSAIVAQAEIIKKQCVHFDNVHYNSSDRKLDKILTSKYSGFPIMLLLLAVVFYLTITGANVPSKLLTSGFFG